MSYLRGVVVAIRRSVTIARLLLAAMAAACVPRTGGKGASGIESPDHSTPEVRSSVDDARELDQEGVRRYRTGHFADAIAYFRAAHDLGGPSSEVWNIVRCREGMDDLEGASNAIDEYLALKDLHPQERVDAQREAQALRARASTLTVVTTPPGATVTVDGRAAPGPTPLSVEIRAGMHTVAVRRDGYATVTQTLEARFGRAVIVTLDLERAGR